jgi:hypothetical protein
MCLLCALNGYRKDIRDYVSLGAVLHVGEVQIILYKIKVHAIPIDW